MSSDAADFAGGVSAAPPLRVVLVDDHAILSETLARFLESVDDGGRRVEVVGLAGSLREAVDVLADTLAHVVVVDVNLPDGNGLNLVRRIRERSATIGLVVLTMYKDDATLLGALDAGASSLVLKEEGAEHVLAAIREAVVRPTTFTASGLEDALQRRDSVPRLSPREMEVLTLLADGERVADVAATLYMSQSTVKTHIAKIYSKLGAHNRASAVMTAINLGLIKTRP